MTACARRFLRHHASTPPPAKIKPGRPAPKAGAGTPTDLTVIAEIWPSLLPVPPLTILKKSEVLASVKVGNVIVVKPWPKFVLLPS